MLIKTTQGLRDVPPVLLWDAAVSGHTSVDCDDVAYSVDDGEPQCREIREWCTSPAAELHRRVKNRSLKLLDLKRPSIIDLSRKAEPVLMFHISSADSSIQNNLLLLLLDIPKNLHLI